MKHALYILFCHSEFQYILLCYYYHFRIFYSESAWLSFGTFFIFITFRWNAKSLAVVIIFFLSFFSTTFLHGVAKVILKFFSNCYFKLVWPGLELFIWYAVCFQAMSSIVCTLHPVSGRGGGVGWTSNQIFKKGGLAGRQLFIGGLLRKTGRTFFMGGCNFHMKNKLKSEIFNDKRSLKEKYFSLS